MALVDILRSGINIANNVTASIQGSVTLEQWTGQDGYGAPTYASSVAVDAIIDLTRKTRPTASGQLVTVVATVTCLESISPNGASGRQEPIDPRDRITLPNGATGPIVNVPDAVLDPLTNRPFFNVIYLGENP